jgi:hypothetical protein
MNSGLLVLVFPQFWWTTLVDVTIIFVPLRTVDLDRLETIIHGGSWREQRDRMRIAMNG